MRCRLLLAVALVPASAVPALGQGPMAAGNGAEVERHHVHPWEHDIGYAAAVRSGEVIYVSGVACSGQDMEQAVRDCYGQLDALLRPFGAGSGDVLKETVYTRDMDALIQANGTRKAYYADGRYPASTWLQVDRLFQAGHLLEIDWIVRMPMAGGHAGESRPATTGQR